MAFSWPLFSFPSYCFPVLYNHCGYAPTCPTYYADWDVLFLQHLGFFCAGCRLTVFCITSHSSHAWLRRGRHYFRPSAVPLYHSPPLRTHTHAHAHTYLANASHTQWGCIAARKRIDHKGTTEIDAGNRGCRHDLANRPHVRLL